MDLLCIAEVKVKREEKQSGRVFFENWNISLPTSYLNKSSIFKISKAWKIGVADVNLLLLKIIRIALFWRHCSFLR